MNEKYVGPIQRLVTTQSDVELFISKIINPDDPSIKLSDAQQLKLDRMHICKGHIDKRGSRTKVVPLVMNECQVSRSEAYRIYNDTIQVFDVVNESTGRDVWVDILLGNILDDRAKAIAANDIKSAVAADKLFAEVIDTFFGGYEAKKYAQIQPPSVTFVFSPAALSVEQKKNLDQEVEQLLKSKSRKNEIFDQAQIITNDPDTGSTDQSTG